MHRPTLITKYKALPPVNKVLRLFDRKKALESFNAINKSDSFFPAGSDKVGVVGGNKLDI